MTRTAIAGLCALVLLGSGAPGRADSDFTLPVGGPVTLELLESAGSDNQTLSVSRALGEGFERLGGRPNGCRGREIFLGSEPLIVPQARRGCRIHLDPTPGNADDGAPAFPA